MKEIYLKMWELAKPYYLKARPEDVDHIQWMMKDAMFICEQENIDDSLLLPLVIFHDVGYALVDSTRFLEKGPRKEHMKQGARIVKEELTKLNYDKNKIEKISYYISVHDNWSFGEVDIYITDIILGTFKDLDYIWTYTKIGFDARTRDYNKTPREFLIELIDEPSPIHSKKPFSNKTTEKLHIKYLEERKKEILK